MSFYGIGGTASLFRPRCAIAHHSPGIAAVCLPGLDTEQAAAGRNQLVDEFRAKLAHVSVGNPGLTEAPLACVPAGAWRRDREEPARPRRRTRRILLTARNST